MRNEDVIYAPVGVGGPSLKSTVVSIVPFPIDENKPGLIPGSFHLDASKDGKPQTLVIGESIHYVYIDSDRGSLKVIDPSYQVAKAVVEDYLRAQLATDVAVHPGLFWLLGEFTPDQIIKDHKVELESARVRQLNWFIELVKMADDDWEKTRQHYVISDTQRYAARAIDPQNTRLRPWLITPPKEGTIATLEMAMCPACVSEVPKQAVVCRSCGCILDVEKHRKLAFADTKGK